CPERHANADLRSTSDDGGRGDAKEANGGQHERKSAEEGGEPRNEPLLMAGGVDLIFERTKREREIPIDGHQPLGDTTCERYRRAGPRANAHTDLRRLGKECRPLRDRKIQGGVGLATKRLIQGVTHDADDGPRFLWAFRWTNRFLYRAADRLMTRKELA